MISRFKDTILLSPCHIVKSRFHFSKKDIVSEFPKMDFQDQSVPISVGIISPTVFRKKINDFKFLGKKKVAA